MVWSSPYLFGLKEFHLACVGRVQIKGLPVQTPILTLAALMLHITPESFLAAVAPYGVNEITARPARAAQKLLSDRRHTPDRVT